MDYFLELYSCDKLEAMKGTERKIVLYDGVCNLCADSIQFILPRDPRGIFRFAPLQGEFAKSVLAQYGISDLAALESVILIEDGKPVLFSSAALRIARQLTFPWNLSAVFLVVPRPIRDAVYRWIARNRYRWFGKQAACLLPRPEWRTRFLE